MYCTKIGSNCCIIILTLIVIKQQDLYKVTWLAILMPHNHLTRLTLHIFQEKSLVAVTTHKGQPGLDVGYLAPCTQNFSQWYATKINQGMYFGNDNHNKNHTKITSNVNWNQRSW